MPHFNLAIIPFFGTPGTTELIIIGIIALLLFGKRLPEVARSIGGSFSAFKKGLTDAHDDLEETAQTAKRSVEDMRRTGDQVGREITDSIRS